jgi:hypothetical protein
LLRIAARHWCAFAAAILALASLLLLRAGPQEERPEAFRSPYPAISVRSAPRGLVQQDLFGIDPARLILYAPTTER